MEKGNVIISKAGRDEGRWMVVVNNQGESVLVCDGKERPLEKPKVKNPRHLQKTAFNLSPNQYETDKMLKRTLASLQKEDCNLG